MMIICKGGSADGREFEIRELIPCIDFILPLPLSICADMKEPEISSKPRIHRYHLVSGTEAWSVPVYASEDIKE